MKENTPAAVILSIGLVISAVILYAALASLGKKIVTAGMHAGQTQPIRIPNDFTLRTQHTAPVTLKLENSPGGASLKIETENKSR